jgi:hypothetical protein
MKRLLVAATVAAAAAFVPATAAYADHVCIYSQGQPVYCTTHYDISINEICVTSGGRDVVCVP